MNTVIYYGVESKLDTGLRANSPKRVTLSSPKDAGANFNLCPAFKEQLTNLFYVPAPFDYNLRFDEKTFFETDYYSQTDFNNLIYCRSMPERLVSFNLYFHLLTNEKSLSVSQTPAYLNNNDFAKNTVVIPGKFDVGKWPRPLELAFFMRNNFEIKENDPLFYVKFDTDEKITFKRFLVSEKYKEIMTVIYSTKNYKKNVNSLFDYYNLIVKFPKLKKLLIVEAEKNLLE